MTLTAPEVSITISVTLLKMKIPTYDNLLEDLPKTDEDSILAVK